MHTCSSHIIRYIYKILFHITFALNYLLMDHQCFLMAVPCCILTLSICEINCNSERQIMQTSKENNFILVRTEFLYLNTNPLGLRNQLCQELFREQWSPFHTTTLISCNLSYKARASEKNAFNLLPQQQQPLS